MNLQGALLEGARVTVLGLAIVFSVLIILMIVMIIMEKVFYKAPKTQQDTPAAEVQEPIPQATQAQDMNDEELIAVLTAAVAASLKTSTYNLQIKSYRRIGQNTPAWRRAGINDTINSRL